MNNKIIIFTIFLFILIVKISFLNNEKTTKNKKNVFIDLGANTGDSIHYFFNSTTFKPEFLKGYGSIGDKKWIVYAVEANPYFNNALDKVKSEIESLGHTVYLYKETAAWIRNEKLTFYLDTVNKVQNYWGSSLEKDHPDVLKSNGKRITINGLDVSELLAKYSSNDEILLKMDIEGSEYKILIHLMQENTLRLVDIIAIEFHERLLDAPFKNRRHFILNYLNIYNVTFVKWR